MGQRTCGNGGQYNGADEACIYFYLNFYVDKYLPTSDEIYMLKYCSYAANTVVHANLSTIEYKKTFLQMN